MRGRPAKSEAVKRLAGNPGKRKTSAERGLHDVETGAGEFSAPVGLTTAAKQVWRNEIGQLRDLNLLKPTDLSAFAVYCEVSARWAKARRVVDRQGMTYESVSKHGTMVRVRPEVGILERAERSMRQFMESLGMTSASRIRTLGQLAGRGQLPLPFEPTPPAPGTSPHGDDPVGYLN